MWSVLEEFLGILFKTLLWLFIIISILTFPLTLPVRLGMIVLAVVVAEAPWHKIREFL